MTYLRHKVKSLFLMEDQYQRFSPNIPDNQPRHTIRYTPASQFGILVGMAFVGMVIGNIAGLVPFFANGIRPSALPAAMDNPANANLMRLAQVIGTFFTFLFPVGLFRLIVQPPKDFLHLQTKSGGRVWLLVALLAFVSLPVTDLMDLVNQIIPLPSRLSRFFHTLEDSYNGQVMMLMQMKSLPDLFFSILIVALLPAIFEETFFRGGLQSLLIQWTRKPYQAIVVASAIFSAIHFSYYGFLPRAFLGVVLGCVYYWTKDLKLNIMIHFINNTVSVVTMYVLARKNELTPDKMNVSLPWYCQIGGLVLFVFFLSLLYKSLHTRNANTSKT